MKKSPGIVTPRPSGKRACDECNLYTAHMSHPGLVYQFFHDANGGYHRHIACCLDLGLRIQTERIQ